MIPCCRSRGTALVITLIAVSVLATIATAFLSSMSVERLTSNNYASLAQAQLAADAALEDLKSLLARESLPSMFFLIGTCEVGNDYGPFLTLGRKNLLESNEITPLVSGDLTDFFQKRDDASIKGLQELRAQLIADATDSSRVTNLNFLSESGIAVIDSSDGHARQYPGRWRYLHDTVGNKVARYAFVVLDEQAKININIAGGVETSNRALDVVDGSDIVIVADRRGYLNEGEFSRLRADPIASALSLWSFGQVFENRVRSQQSRMIFTALTNSQPDLIPAGYFDASGNFVDYHDAGLPKHNINELATNSDFGVTASARAHAIADVIEKNLPNFKSRDPSFGKTGDIRYVQRIAASIVDYVDMDTMTTKLHDGEPAGMDLQGLVAGVVEEYMYRGATPSGSGYNVEIDHTVYVQLWNPYTTDTSGTFRIQLESFRPVNVPGAIQTPLPIYDQEASVTIRGNEFKVVKLGTQRAKIFTPTYPSPGPSMEQTGSATNRPKHSVFRAFWEGTLCNWTPNGFADIDDRGPGLVKAPVSSMKVGESYWSGNLPQSQFLAGRGYRAVADPRQNYSENYAWAARSLTSNRSRFRFNGRSDYGSNDYSTTENSTGQDFNRMWIGRDYLPEAPVLGILMNSDKPDAVASPYTATERDRAPSVIANARMKSIGELGNIYDPANVSETGLAARGGNPSAWWISGGGRTLRVGQPEREFPSISPSGSERKAPDWSKPGLSANHLLDLFTVKPLNAQGIPEGRPRLNINTASKEALVSLLWKLKVLGDPNEKKSVISRDKAERIAEKIIEGRPYNNFKDMEHIMDQLVKPTSYEDTLGVTRFNYPSHLGGNQEVKTALVSDRAVEGSFRRIVENIGISTRNLRVIVVGQALSPKGKVLAQTRREAILKLDLKVDDRVSTDQTAYRIDPRVVYASRL